MSVWWAAINSKRLSDGAKQIKIADKIASVRDIMHTPPAHWPAIRKTNTSTGPNASSPATAV